ncbi:antitoxin [Streptomyces sp. NPDC001020]
MFDALKNLKNKAEELAETHGETISQGLAKVGDLIDDKTDRKYSDKIDTGVEKAQGFVERMGEKKTSD